MYVPVVSHHNVCSQLLLMVYQNLYSDMMYPIAGVSDFHIVVVGTFCLILYCDPSASTGLNCL